MSDGRGRTATLSAAAHEVLQRHGQAENYPAGAVIITSGDEGRALYVVLSGEVEVRLPGSAKGVPLARLGKGAFFGEMALLCGDRVSADVVACVSTDVLTVPAERFMAALATSEALRSDLLTILASRVRDTNAEVGTQHRRAETLAALFVRPEPCEPVVAESPAMRRVMREVESLTAQPGPVAVVGPPGSGRGFIARAVHETGSAAGSPLIEVDCERLQGEDIVGLLLGAGAAAGEGSSNGGVLGLAAGGTLVFRNVEHLAVDAQQTLAARMEPDRETVAGSPAARIVVTAEASLAEPASAGRIDRELAARFSKREIRLPRLVDRRRDILPLVELFLAARGANAAALPIATTHAFMNRRYEVRHVAELREAVDLALMFAGGGEIRPEHIFTGPKNDGSPNEVEVSQTPLVRRLLEGRRLATLRLATLIFFVGTVSLCLAVPERAAGQLANLVIWGAWEPALVLAFFAVGRVWCTFCPLSTLGLLARRLGTLERRVPVWLKRASPWLAAVGFLAIIWFERTFHMLRQPAATGLLLVALMATVLAFALILEREAWCAHVCPLGALGAGLSLPAVLHVRASPSVCATFCASHVCFKGDAETTGCTVFHHPLFATEGHQCKLCLSCLRVCPHGSVRLYARPPLQAVWRLGALSEKLSPFVLSIVALAPVMLAAQGGGWIAGAAGLAVTGLAALALGFAAAGRLPRWLRKHGEGAEGLAAQIAFTFLVAAWGPLMAYQLGNVPILGQVIISPAHGTPIERLLPPTGIAVTGVLQALVIALAVVLAAFCLWRVAVRASRAGDPLPGGIRLATLTALGTYAVVAFVALVG